MGRILFTGIKKGKGNKNQHKNHRSGNRPNGLCAVRTDGGRDWDCRRGNDKEKFVCEKSCY